MRRSRSLGWVNTLGTKCYSLVTYMSGWVYYNSSFYAMQPFVAQWSRSMTSCRPPPWCSSQSRTVTDIWCNNTPCPQRLGESGKTVSYGTSPEWTDHSDHCLHECNIHRTVYWHITLLYIFIRLFLILLRNGVLSFHMSATVPPYDIAGVWFGNH